MSTPQNTIAIVYDYDQTLSPSYMQDDRAGRNYVLSPATRPPLQLYGIFNLHFRLLRLKMSPRQRAEKDRYEPHHRRDRKRAAQGRTWQFQSR